MKTVFALIAATFLLQACGNEKKILLVAGGHDFDTSEFFSVFESLNDLSFDQVYHPRAVDVLKNGAEEYDVLVFYDFIPGQPAGDSIFYQNLSAKGIPMLFLHHSLCNFQQWDGFREMVGGKYLIPDFEADSSLHSAYRHDIDLDIRIADPGHPVTLGMEGFTIHDEGYSNIQVMDGITPLLLCDHPDASPLMGWTKASENSQVVYLMFGHDKQAYTNPSYTELIRNAIHWLAAQNQQEKK